MMRHIKESTAMAAALGFLCFGAAGCEQERSVETGPQVGYDERGVIEDEGIAVTEPPVRDRGMAATEGVGEDEDARARFGAGAEALPDAVGEQDMSPELEQEIDRGVQMTDEEAAAQDMQDTQQQQDMAP